MKTLIYKPTQNRKTQEIINDILSKLGSSINIIFTDNLCMLGLQTSERIIKEVDGFKMYRGDDSKTISINCESSDIEGVSRKQIATHVIGLIITEGIRNIITLTNSVRLPQMRRLIDLLTEIDSLGRPGIVPFSIPNINIYFDEADKTINSILRELEEKLDCKFINDYYITATPKKLLKKYGEMELYKVNDTLKEYMSLEDANWINIGTHEYMDALRSMLDKIKYVDGGYIRRCRFIFAPGMILKDSHYDIAEEATNVYNCVSIVVNSDGFNIFIPETLGEEYLSPVYDYSNNRIPKIPEKFKESINRSSFSNVLKRTGDKIYYKLNFKKKQLIKENENEFWKIIEVAREFWKDNPILVTGSRCVERGITIQNPFNEKVRFTDGMLHSNIAKSDSGSQMAGRFTLTYNSTLKKEDFIPVNIYSDERTRLYMINHEKKAKYAVKLASSGKKSITYHQWKTYEKIAVLGHKSFKSFREALKWASNNLTNNGHEIYYNEKKDYSESNKRLGSCNMLMDGEYKGYRYNSFNSREPTGLEEFRKKGTQYLFWSKEKRGCATAYRIWAIYHDIKDVKSLVYHLCWSPLAEVSDYESSSDYESAEEF